MSIRSMISSVADSRRLLLSLKLEHGDFTVTPAELQRAIGTDDWSVLEDFVDEDMSDADVAQALNDNNHLIAAYKAHKGS